MQLSRKLLWLATLYVVQGLPYGFQAVVLKLYLREAGLSLTEISLVGFVALPWTLKALWAPAIDRYGSSRLGRRRSWILPLQGLLAITLALIALSPPSKAFGVLLLLLSIAHFVAATMDVAVDGLAIDLLDKRHLGYGNIAQVAGYKVGMVIGGNLLVAAGFDWPQICGAMALIVGFAWLLTLRSKEPPTTSAESPMARGEVLRRLRDAFVQQRAFVLFAAIAFYKLGEKMADQVFDTMLYDAGYDKSAVAGWLAWGMAFSIAGSFAGGVLAARLRLVDALLFVATLRVLPHVAQLYLSTGALDHEATILGVTSAEGFFGGALTTVMFAFMMSRVDPRIGASHYTLLAVFEVLGKIPADPIAGVVGDAFGYSSVFALAVGLSIAYLVLPAILRAREPSSPAPAGF